MRRKRRTSVEASSTWKATSSRSTPSSAARRRAASTISGATSVEIETSSGTEPRQCQEAGVARSCGEVERPSGPAQGRAARRAARRPGVSRPRRAPAAVPSRPRPRARPRCSPRAGQSLTLICGRAVAAGGRLCRPGGQGGAIGARRRRGLVGEPWVPRRESRSDTGRVAAQKSARCRSQPDATARQASMFSSRALITPSPTPHLCSPSSSVTREHRVEDGGRLGRPGGQCPAIRALRRRREPVGNHGFPHVSSR